MSSKVGDAGYRIIAPIASGGMGEVYKAEHIITRRLEAIKVLSGAGTEEQSERFLREIQLQASLSHPNIAAVYNAFRVNDDLVMVMELVEGEPLRELLGRGRLPLPVALNYACQALRAIAYAHAHGVVHRDITPANIIITPQGIVKLTDFGLAKAAASPSVSQSGTSMGSPHYMSPEQVKDSTRTTPRSDIYSLGAVLYEMATGKKVFDGDSSFSVMQAQVQCLPVPPVQVEPRIPQALNTAILTALEKDPESRYPSADAFRLAVESVMLGPERIPAATPRKKRAPRRQAVVVAIIQAAVVCTVIVVAARVISTTRREAEIKRAHAMVERQAPSPRPAPVERPTLPDEAPRATAQSQPLAGKVVSRPANRHAVRPARNPRDLTPRVLGQAPPTQAMEPVRVLGSEAPPRLAESSPSVPAGEEKEQPAASAAAPEPPSTEAKGAQSSAAAEADTTPPEKEKKVHNRFRRVLGKILGPFH